ncbi:hypothetical protein RBSWK_02099 [Rhodopirellula baltica SWK14]|uniref:Uncharacterized protein n=1 Tax=Rhodopirellula baltica SWK14 TaxID=993516 RepID=L7CJ01_RHOBT|nr:hypothetical protein RBSWK_02099 [Rhodopirellula baltica SWK14]
MPHFWAPMIRKSGKDRFEAVIHRQAKRGENFPYWYHSNRL